MANGKVKFFNIEKGFGFISRDGDIDVFVHKTDLRATGIDTLTEGQSVKFDVVPGRENKPKATNITLGLP